MKETIYTIPINEAFDLKCSCPICSIENKIENDQIEATLGPAMMEPDFRINSNNNGFCKTGLMIFKKTLFSKKTVKN